MYVGTLVYVLSESGTVSVSLSPFSMKRHMHVGISFENLNLYMRTSKRSKCWFTHETAISWKPLYIWRSYSTEMLCGRT